MRMQCDDLQCSNMANSLHLAQIYARIFGRGHLWGEQFSESVVWGTYKVCGQISEYILRQMKAIVLIIFQIFFETHTVLKIVEHHSDIIQFQLGNIQSRDAFKPIVRELK